MRRTISLLIVLLLVVGIVGIIAATASFALASPIGGLGIELPDAINPVILTVVGLIAYLGIVAIGIGIRTIYIISEPFSAKIRRIRGWPHIRYLSSARSSPVQAA